MKKTLLGAKLHQATVTQCELDYEGSMSIDEEILSAVNILPNEQVHVYNINNGKRFVTYAIPAPAGSRVICANGACARLANKHDRVIICTYVVLTSSEWTAFRPAIAMLDERNNFTLKEKEIHKLDKIC